ncbi:DUF2975 domain-containing protein [Psychroserpens damuponensis]|uniref:DUF2975 domain-containing protein n=1 Tax=Psychroserpens damuponensis TaxID=943936 RepID=UPI00058D710B|nr:DUF2975 domain-containing protein [Psychroserpens damuponensis]
MKKIQFLNGFVLLLIILYVINFLGNAYLTWFSDFLTQFEHLYENFIFGYYTQFVGLVFSIITFIGLLSVKSGLKEIIKQGFFNSISAGKFIIGGKLFLISGLLNFIFNLILLFRSEEMLFVGEIGQSFLLMIIGFSLYIISDILQNGNLLKQENELTI